MLYQVFVIVGPFEDFRKMHEYRIIGKDSKGVDSLLISQLFQETHHSYYYFLAHRLATTTTCSAGHVRHTTATYVRRLWGVLPSTTGPKDASSILQDRYKHGLCVWGYLQRCKCCMCGMIINWTAFLGLNRWDWLILSCAVLSESSG